MRPATEQTLQPGAVPKACEDLMEAGARLQMAYAWFPEPGEPAEDVFAPVIFSVRADVELMDLDAGLVDQREILIAGAGGLSKRDHREKRRKTKYQILSHFLHPFVLAEDSIAPASTRVTSRR